MHDQTLVEEFDEAMHDIYRRALKEAGYKASIFLDMLFKHGGLETARRLINSPKVSEGYTALWDRRRLDLSVEAVVVENPKWHPLFSDKELANCRKRLTAYNYTPKAS